VNSANKRRGYIPTYSGKEGLTLPPGKKGWKGVGHKYARAIENVKGKKKVCVGVTGVQRGAPKVSRGRELQRLKKKTGSPELP